MAVTKRTDPYVPLLASVVLLVLYVVARNFISTPAINADRKVRTLTDGRVEVTETVYAKFQRGALMVQLNGQWQVARCQPGHACLYARLRPKWPSAAEAPVPMRVAHSDKSDWGLFLSSVNVTRVVNPTTNEVVYSHDQSPEHLPAGD